MRNRLCTLWVLAGLLTAGAASASQVPGHVYVALNAYYGAPPRVKAIIERHWTTYLVGSMGPDMGTTTWLVAQALDIEHPGSEAHYTKTGRLVANLFREAAKLDSPEEREAGTAYALGWLTHYCTDLIIHPLVNEFGGDFGGGAEAQVWHKRLELVECENAFQKGVGSVDDYTIEALAVPISLVTAAFYRTYRNPIYDYWNQWGLHTFNNDFRKSALVVCQCSEWMADCHQAAEGASGGVFRRIFKGAPPTPTAFREIMNPLEIEDVTIELPDPASGRTEASIRVDYTVRDLRLLKLFCLEWDQRIPTAIANTIAYMREWNEDPDTFVPPDRNLDTGGEEGVHFDPANEWPGRPKIAKMLGFLRITDETGRDLSPWPNDGQFIALPFEEAGTGDISRGGNVGVVERWTGWNEGIGGRAFFKVPFSPGESESIDVNIRLVLADDNKRIYGWPDRGIIIETTFEKQARGQKQAEPPAPTPAPQPVVEEPQPAEAPAETPKESEGFDGLSFTVPLYRKELGLSYQRDESKTPDQEFTGSVTINLTADGRITGSIQTQVIITNRSLNQPDSVYTTKGTFSGTFELGFRGNQAFEAEGKGTRTWNAPYYYAGEIVPNIGQEEISVGVEFGCCWCGRPMWDKKGYIKGYAGSDTSYLFEYSPTGQVPDSYALPH